MNQATISMTPKTYKELYEAVKNTEIVSAIGKDGRTYRLFIATNEHLCYFKKGSSRRGYTIHETDFSNFVSFKGKSEPKNEVDKLKKQYNTIAKYKKLAAAATFTNSFIEDCKKLPDFETWKNDVVIPSYGEQIAKPKGMYELGITTGNKIDGRVISLDRIAKQYPRVIEQLREAIKNQSEGHFCSRYKFDGYEMTISTAKREVGEFIGYLSLEYKDCGNGYYYLLINDENFIGYDVD